MTLTTEAITVKKLHLLALLGALLALLVAPASARADLRVVGTIAAIAREVGGEKVSVESLALPTQDPHFVDAKPSLALALSKADLLLAVGLGLEVGWLPTLQVGSRNVKIMLGASGYLETSSLVTLLDPPAVVDRSQGDVHAGGNPHFWYDPRAVAAIARGVSAKMAALDPPNKAHYEKQLAAFLGKLDGQRKAWELRLAKRKGAPVIAYHKSWTYLGQWVGLDQVAFLEPKPGVPPNPGHVAQVLAIGKAKGVKILLQESYYPDATAKLVAEKMGAGVVSVPSGPDVRGGQGYFAWMESVVAMLEKGSS
jgi:zinc/manganese transport system substrate-binding protein